MSLVSGGWVLIDPFYVLGLVMLFFALLLLGIFIAELKIHGSSGGISNPWSALGYFMVRVYTVTGFLVGGGVGFILGKNWMNALLLAPLFAFLGMSMSYKVGYGNKMYRWF
ncbi:MAG: hypothetical protein ABH950_05370 [Candidatus Altiarchaeota archaeon]